MAALHGEGQGWTSRPGDGWRMGLILLVGAVLTVVQAVHRASYVLDDWYAVRNVEFGGAWAAADEGLRISRPGAALTFGLSFGYAGHDHVAMLLVRMALLLASAVLAFLILRRFFPREIPTLVVVTWLVLPNHMSLEFWPSALVATTSMVALLGGVLLLTSRRLSWWKLGVVCALFVLAVLTYESSALPAAAAAVLVPWIVARRIQWRPILAVAGALAATSVWTLLEWHDVKTVHNDLSQYTDLFQAHFGWGVFPKGPLATIGIMAGLVGVVLVLGRLAIPERRAGAGPADALVCAGLAVMVLGSLTFALYYYAPLGAGDRVSYLSSLGGAMIVVGLLWLVWQHRRAVAVALAAVILVGAVAARVERTALWETAGNDADRILEAVKLTDPTCTAVFLGPAPIQRQNVAAYLDQSNVDGMVQVALGRQDVSGVMTFDQAAFDRAPEECRVDIRPLSELTPDVVARPT